MSYVIDSHREYLSDHARLDAYRRALLEVVRPGDTVIDLGSGTGILGLLACEAGAARIYSIEVSAMTEVARAIAQANGFGDRVVFVREHSRLVELPERADLLVTDQVGHFGFEAGLWDYISDAADRLLKPDGRIVPAAVELFVAPVEASDLFTRVEFWTTRPAGFDFASAREWAAHSGYPATLAREALLSDPCSVCRASTIQMGRAPFAVQARCLVDRAGTMHGLGGWFEAQLSPGVRMTNAPGAANRINRRNLFLPIDRAVAVSVGDTVEATLHIDPIEMMLSWVVRHTTTSGSTESFVHSTLRGMLLGPEDLQRARPDYRPSLTPRGVARRTVLELCDGQRPLAEIERAVFDRHRELFRTADDASVFVAEVVSRYTS